MNKKIIAIIICSILAIIIFISLMYGKGFFMSFQESVSLDYQRIDINGNEIIHIRIWGNSNLVGDAGEFILDDKDDIEYLLNFINALELVNKEMPKQRNFQNNGHFYLEIYGNNDYEDRKEILDIFLFTTQYLSVIHRGHDWDYTDYFIKDSGYNCITQSSRTYEFLYELINR